MTVPLLRYELVVIYRMGFADVYVDRTARNALSPLLKLPTELKDRIYYYALGDHFFHVETLAHTAEPSRIFPCRSTPPKLKAHDSSSSALENNKNPICKPSAEDLIASHARCECLSSRHSRLFESPED